MAAYLNDEYKLPKPSIRLLASINITEENIDLLINTLLEAVNILMIKT